MLASVARIEYPNFDVYLVDNGSVDGSANYVQRNFPLVETIRHSRNLGFAEVPI
jgi:GT2 family glycosyltransferase